MQERELDTSVTSTKRARSWLTALLAQRSVQITVFSWVAANILVLVLAQGNLPFHRPSLHDVPFATQVLSPNLAILEVFVA